MSGRQYTKHYTERPSPPFPANMNCGKTKIGNDGRYWTSVAASNGVCRWVPGGKVAVRKRRTASKPKRSGSKPMAKRSRSKSMTKRAASKPKAKAVKRRSVSAKRSSRSASPCPRGKKVIHRKAYTRSDGLRVKATNYCRKK